MKSLRDLLRGRIRKMSEFIEEPLGFPDEPENHIHWIWTGVGSSDRSPSPMVSFLGRRVAVRRLLYAFHHHLYDHTPLVRRTCHCAACVNPLHAQPSSYSQVISLPAGSSYRLEDLVDGSYDPAEDYFREFRDIGAYEGQSIDEIARMTGLKHSIIEEYLPQYLLRS